MFPRVAAVVLAAGASRRMGRPKALIEWRGRPFFMHCVRRAQVCGCGPIVVVWGAVSLPKLGPTLVHNPHWSRGPLSSLQSGLRAVVSARPTGVLVMTVDRPHVCADTIRRLVHAHGRRPNVVVQPRVGQTSGHPIIHPRSVVDEILRLSSEDTVRTVLARPAVRGKRLRIPVRDRAVLDNLDTTGDLAALGMVTSDR